MSNKRRSGWYGSGDPKQTLEELTSHAHGIVDEARRTGQNDSAQAQLAQATLRLIRHTRVLRDDMDAALDRIIDLVNQVAQLRFDSLGEPDRTLEDKLSVQIEHLLEAGITINRECLDYIEPEALIESLYDYGFNADPGNSSFMVRDNVRICIVPDERWRHSAWNAIAHLAQQDDSTPLKVWWRLYQQSQVIRLRGRGVMGH